jgi:hypothetical protein
MASLPEHGSPSTGALNSHAIGSVALWLSLLTFGVYFLGVLIGGPLGMKPWMSDVGQMLTLAFAVILFVAGTVAREYESQQNAEAAAAAAVDGGGAIAADDSSRC